MWLSKGQYQQVASILSGIGHIFFASVFIHSVLNIYNPSLALLGLVAALAMWIASVIFTSEAYGIQS